MLGLGLLAAVAPLWLVDYLPLVDLPQHAAQVATWHRWAEPPPVGGLDVRALLEINLRTPYLLSRLLAYGLAFLVPVLDAYRVLLSFTVVGIPLAVLLLLRRTGGSPWWALATLPLGYGYAFYWGFIAYGLAVPLGLVYLAFVLDCARAPSRRRMLGLWLATQLLFFAHVFVFGWAGLMAAAVLGLHVFARPVDASGSGAVWAARARGLATAWGPLLAALPLPLVWIAATRSAEAQVSGRLLGAWDIERLAQAFRFLVAGEHADPTATLLGLALFGVPLVLGARPSRRLARWAPCALSLLVYLAAPMEAFGTAFIYPRFAVFLLPTWLMALEPRRPPDRRVGLLVALVAVALFDVGMRLQRFDDEVGAFDRAVATMEPGRRVLYCALDPTSQHVGSAAYLHFGVWYQVEKGGLVEFSFAHFFPNLLRYQAGAEPPLPKDFDWGCWRFDYAAHGGAHYDYFLVRSLRHDPYGILFSEALDRVEPVAQFDGGWFLYRQRG